MRGSAGEVGLSKNMGSWVQTHVVEKVPNIIGSMNECVTEEKPLKGPRKKLKPNIKINSRKPIPHLGHIIKANFDKRRFLQFFFSFFYIFLS